MSRSAWRAALKALRSARPSRTGLPRACLGGVEGRLEPHRQVGKDAVGALHLLGGQGRGARGIASDGVEMSEQRLDFLFELIGEPLDAPRQPAGGDEHANLRDRDGERRDGDDAEEDVSPGAHALSRARACW